MKIPINGGPATTLATDQNPNWIAVDGTSVYWTNYESDNTGTVKKVPIGGGSVTTLASGPIANLIAVDSTSAYWVSYDSNSVGTLMRLTPK